MFTSPGLGTCGSTTPSGDIVLETSLVVASLELCSTCCLWAVSDDVAKCFARASLSAR